jgi:hypothetical protein
MNWAARKRGKREMNGGPRTRREWTTERASETGLYPRGFGCRAEHAVGSIAYSFEFYPILSDVEYSQSQLEGSQAVPSSSLSKP